MTRLTSLVATRHGRLAALGAAALAVVLVGLVSWSPWQPRPGVTMSGGAVPGATSSGIAEPGVVSPGVAASGSSPPATDPVTDPSTGGTVQVPPGDPRSGRPGSADSAPQAGAYSVWWRPTVGMTWQWQLSGRLDRSVDAQVYDIDAVESSASDVAALHAAGRKVICYVNAGAFEDWRPDAGRFPAEVRGKPLDGWPGERWLDIRRWDVLEPIMTARFEACRTKGFDAVEPDNVDGYGNHSGFPLSAADQLTYNRRLAGLGHRMGLAIGLKNDVEQASALQPAFDFAVNEECVAFDECAALRVFVAAGKPVFHVEYTGDRARVCAVARGLVFSSIRKRVSLDAWREPC